MGGSREGKLLSHISPCANHQAGAAFKGNLPNLYKAHQLRGLPATDLMHTGGKPGVRCGAHSGISSQFMGNRSGCIEQLINTRAGMLAVPDLLRGYSVGQLKARGFCFMLFKKLI